MRTKSELALKALEIIGRAAMATSTIIEVLLTSPYGSPRSALERRASEIERLRLARREKEKLRRQFYDLIYRLNRDGIIEKRSGVPGDRVWSLTAKGKNQLKFLKKHHGQCLPQNQYSKKIDSEVKIIAFDIPEKYKNKRRWLRGALSHLGFSMLQKSVWIGKAMLPREFLEDLNELSLVPFIEILVVTKTGSLRSISAD